MVEPKSFFNGFTWHTEEEKIEEQKNQALVLKSPVADLFQYI